MLKKNLIIVIIKAQVSQMPLNQYQENPVSFKKAIHKATPQKNGKCSRLKQTNAR